MSNAIVSILHDELLNEFKTTFGNEIEEIQSEIKSVLQLKLMTILFKINRN